MTSSGMDTRPLATAGLATLLRRRPVGALPDVTVRDALHLMAAERVGSIVVVDGEAARPLGVLTQRDIIERVVLPGGDLEEAVAGVMTGGVVSLPLTASAHLARLILARHDLRRLVVVNDDGAFVGVVSRGDLYASRSLDGEDLVEAIHAAGTVDALAAAAQRIREAAGRMVEEGASASHVCEWIAIFNDLVVLSAVDLAEAEFDLPLVPWSWLAFGSEGRLEQTLDTDQDNGLIFVPETEADTEALRERFLPFAQRVNALLDACGFPLCKGEVMAGNPRWCLSMAEWRDQFAGWISSAMPDDLLNATIFFDFRAVAGDVGLAASLQRWLLACTGDNDLFLRFMADNALRGGVPLGRIRDFVVDRESGLLDLKRDGSRIFVDAARILALASGVFDTATVGRLQAVGSQLGWPRREVAAYAEAFDFIQQLRLRGQHDKAGPPNRIAPAALNELERAFLKESFRQARKLQHRLQLRYQL
ncbi:MAG: DUF294 nucleotidyltransferase-like domain-containing protein [Zoogloea sp.]|uniref:DUF294 nucleotidyltransferase-like domain-containing protein n=1 Tax=Zoogloea sp. TaxID=49181 RepID=UPI0026033FAF|nr:DUF294 nucleotidyltransferase-like domain-containing protein [Zoogloea sp.]MDD2991674.1 DUF294 nucleotidyltransferase-like domain-containing protein [Zoogloea sp.]